MAFGQKTGSLKNLKQSLKKGGGGAFIKYIPKNGAMNVRFVQEPEEWVNYTEHFDQTLRRSYPCNGEHSCPGCQTDERKSSRYLTNAVDLDDNERVIPLQLPKDLANRLVVKYEKWGSLTERDIELSRSGEGLDTTYDLEADPPSRRNLAKYQPHDLEKVLEEAYQSVFGGGEDDEAAAAVADSGPTTRRTRKKSAAARATVAADPVDVDEDEDDEPEEEAPKPAKKAAAKKAAAKKAPAKKAAAKKAAAPEPEFDTDDEDDDDEDVPASAVEDDEPDVDDDGDEPVYDEDTLRALPLGALRSVARDFGVSTRGKDADAIIEEILDMGEEVEDDEPPF